MKEFWKPLFMGVDIGTQSVKVCIFDSEGMMLAKHSERQYMHVPASGWAVESPGLWWDWSGSYQWQSEVNREPEAP